MQSYQHVDTKRHIHIDGPTDQFYSQDKTAISAKQALDLAMPAGQTHSHSNDPVPQKAENVQAVSRDFGIGF